jgi:para-nitrobenzyl esterase
VRRHPALRRRGARAPGSARLSPVAETALGPLRGREERGVLAFRGVPYAEPPVGALRFAPPRAPRPWAGLRDATRFGPVAPQRPEALVRELGLEPRGDASEDCLTLNVWTPALDGRRPVLVWLHGGAFAGGSCDVPLYDGARLAREGDAVVVTVQYRVGALGFLYLGPGRANFGLQDQVAALHFVRRHAARFGGDPDRVTVFGESAGAGSVCALLAMPAARRLFRRAIAQSPAPAAVLASAEAAERAAKLLGPLGLAAGDLEGLRRVPVAELLDAQEKAEAEGPHRRGMLFMPVVDGEVLPTTPLRAAAAGAARGVELLIGTTREEMHLYALTGLGERIPEALLPRVFAAQLAGEVRDPEAVAGRLVAGYRRLLAAGGAAPAPAELFYAIQTALGLRWHSALLAERHAAQQVRTYAYVFTWPSPARGGALRACHALDLPFTFGNLAAPGLGELAGGGPEAEALSERMRGAWLAFARSGNPSHPGLGEWPPCAPPRRAVMELGARCGVLLDPFAAERALWAGLDWREP